jgi:hypothetical protein
LQGSIRALLEIAPSGWGDDSGPAVGGTVQSLLRIIGTTGKVAAGVAADAQPSTFFGRILPEFGRVTCLVQHDLYHRYTVDDGTRCVHSRFWMSWPSRGEGNRALP